MKIALIGNICNVAYTLKKILEPDHEVSLYITYKKKSDLDQFKDILDEESVHTLCTLCPSLPIRIFSISCKHDLLHASTLSPIYAHLFRKPGVPLVSHCHGTDLREFAHERGVLPWLLRIAYRSSNCLLCVTPDLVKKAHLVGVKETVVLPNTVDDFLALVPKKKPKRTDKKTRIIVAARMHPVKRLDVFFEGFDLFVKKYPQFDIEVVKLVSGNEEIETLKSTYYAHEKFVYKHRMSKQELLAEYLISDIVVDQFGVHVPGLVTYEGLALDKIVMTDIDEQYYSAYKGDPPILNAHTPQDVFEQLELVLVKKKKLGSGLKWIQNNMSSKIVKGLYEAMLKRYIP